MSALLERLHAFFASGPVSFETRIEDHRRLLRKRARGGDPFRRAMAAEEAPPIGQAGLWYQDVIQCVPKSGRDVAKQIARLCGHDSQVTVPVRSLADAVGVRDRAGRQRAYAERGIAVLVDAGWLKVETIGEKRGARTSYYLMPGDLVDWLERPEMADWLEAEGVLDEELDADRRRAA